MHPENRLVAGYDFAQLIDEYPILKPYQLVNEYGKLTLDFSNQRCVYLFNKSLLQKFFKINYWEIPDGHLCPGIPGRADYLHHLHDLIGTGANNILDIGTGASVIYPLLGINLYNWKFVGTDIDETSLKNAALILRRNNISASKIELRYQPLKSQIFSDIVNPNEIFDACICNPPYYHSEEQALRWNEKKWQQKGSSVGKINELVYSNGEVGFIQQMMTESIRYYTQIKYFTCLVSRKSSLPFLEKICASLNISNLRFIEIKTGKKLTRIAIWQT